MSKTPYIFPFQGIRVKNIIYFEGQVMFVNKSTNNISARDSIWRNIKRSYNLYTPKSISKSQRKLDVIINKDKYSFDIDKYGYFYIKAEVKDAINIDVNDVLFFLNKEQIFINDVVNSTTSLLHKTSFSTGVISDIDDTILVSHSRNNLKKSALVGFRNAHTRKIVPETKKIYNILRNKGFQFFYVSNSETNLYLLIKWVTRINNLPPGPIFLKKIKNYRNFITIKSKKSLLEKYSHKIEKIESILSFFPDKKFILIGDSGQKDPEIYLHIIEKYKDRITSVFIRDISKKKRKKDLLDVKNKVENCGVKFHYYSKISDINNYFD